MVQDGLIADRFVAILTLSGGCRQAPMAFLTR
jgi:hypothetical protein